jgi:hypothetical protein
MDNRMPPTDPDITAALAALTPAQRSHISQMNAAVIVACIEELTQRHHGEGVTGDTQRAIAARSEEYTTTDAVA